MIPALLGLGALALMGNPPRRKRLRRRNPRYGYRMPSKACLSRDSAANLSLFLMENVGKVDGKWSGPMRADDQRTLFNRSLGKGKVIIDGAKERLRHVITVGFGMDFDVTDDLTWSDLRRNPGLAPLEPLGDLPTVYHGSRDPKRVLREGYNIGPAINMVHYPEYAWTGCRSGSFCDGGGVKWKGYVWDWWKGLPLAARRRFQAEVGEKIARADDLGCHVQLMFTDKSREEAESYAMREHDDRGYTTKQHEPFALDATKIPNALGYFQPGRHRR